LNTNANHTSPVEGKEPCKDKIQTTLGLHNNTNNMSPGLRREPAHLWVQMLTQTMPVQWRDKNPTRIMPSTGLSRILMLMPAQQRGRTP
jgi:hypothetical protein